MEPLNSELMMTGDAGSGILADRRRQMFPARGMRGDGARVNAVLPGIAETKFTTALAEDEALLGDYFTHVPTKRVVQPQEIAGAVLYRVSPASSFTTGVCLPMAALS